MDVGVAAALIAAVSSLAVAIIAAQFAARGQQKVKELELRHAQEATQRERRHAAQEQLDRYREPLLAAARELENRIDNIRNRAFFAYLTTPDTHRAHVALLSTSYRFARYWGVVEALQRSVNTLKFETEAETKAVHQRLRDIGRTFASDGIDGQTLMVWREEQRAIGELMHAADPYDAGVRIIGFSAFVEQHPTRFAEWLSSLETALQTPGIEKSPRLAELQLLLGKLSQELERGRTLSR